MPDAKSQQSASHVGVALPWWHGTSHGSVTSCGCPPSDPFPSSLPTAPALPRPPHMHRDQCHTSARTHARTCTYIHTQTQTHRRTHTLSHTGGYQDARLEQEGQLLLLLRRPDEHLEPSPRAARPAPGPRPCPTTPTAARDRPPAALAAAVIFRDGWKCSVKLAFEPACPPCSGGPSQASDKQQPALPGSCRSAEAVFGVPCPSLASAKRWPHVPGLVAE